MSLKLFIALILISGLAVYLAFLNPQEVEVYLTQSTSHRMPMIVVLLGSVLFGVAISSVLYWFIEFRDWFRRRSEANRRRKQEKHLRNLEQLFENAENALAGGHKQKGEALFEKILRDNPDHVRTLYQLGNNLRKEGKSVQAIPLHRKAAHLAPDNVKFRYALAEDYAAAGMHQKEIETLAKIQEIDLASLQALFKTRDSYWKMAMWDEACKIQKSILPLLQNREELEKEQDRFGEIIYGSGQRYQEEGDIESAIGEFKRAIRENNRAIPAYVTLGDIYLQNGKRRDALRTWKAGYDTTQALVCLQRLHQTLESSEQFKDIIKMYEAAIRLSNGSGTASLIIQFCAFLLNRGETGKAVKILEAHPLNDSSLLQHILLVTARQAQETGGNLPETIQSIFDKARGCLNKFYCRRCETTLASWSGHCPNCKSWNTVSWGPSPQPIS